MVEREEDDTLTITDWTNKTQGVKPNNQCVIPLVDLLGASKRSSNRTTRASSWCKTSNYKRRKIRTRAINILSK